jgi:N-methylhydantoinase A
MPATVGIDTGGTFTDLVAILGDGSIRVAKEASTPDAPMDAFSRVLAKSCIPAAEIERIVHGTTVATNAVIQRYGANVLLVTTAGFEDIPFIQRLNRRRE